MKEIEIKGEKININDDYYALTKAIQELTEMLDKIRRMGDK